VPINLTKPDPTPAQQQRQSEQQKVYTELAGLFTVLSDRTRLHILTILARGERNVMSLCEELGLPQPTVSHHLGMLRMNGLVANRRAGKQVFYSLDGRTESLPRDGLQFKAGTRMVRIEDGQAEG
jgi:DNA-binding transcriptional ArsR family regulator